MSTSRTPSDSAVKKDVQKLQRAIVDGLEDVKAQDIVVFNTEHLSSLFERVIIASGTSNRQTKALAASVMDAVREAGFTKPRVEGEENGEWIIVDCGQAVVHVMQPSIRQYYHLEEIWGDKPVRLKLGAAKPAPAAKPVAAAPAGKKDVAPSLRRSSAVKTAERAAQRAEQAAEMAAAKPAGRKRAAAPAGSAARAPRKTAAGTFANTLSQAGSKAASAGAPLKPAAPSRAKAAGAAAPKAAKAAKVVVVKPAAKPAPRKAVASTGVAKAARKAPAKKSGRA